MNSLSMMTPDSARPVSVATMDTRKGKGRRTVLTDSREPLFDFPTGPADEGERLEDFDGL